MPGQRKQYIIFVCDGPKCSARRASTTPVTCTIDIDAASNEPIANTPRQMDGSFEISPFGGALCWFCGPQCVKDYLDYKYVKPKFPPGVETGSLDPSAGQGPIGQAAFKKIPDIADYPSIGGGK